VQELTQTPIQPAIQMYPAGLEVSQAVFQPGYLEKTPTSRAKHYSRRRDRVDKLQTKQRTTHEASLRSYTVAIAIRCINYIFSIHLSCPRYSATIGRSQLDWGGVLSGPSHRHVRIIIGEIWLPEYWLVPKHPLSPQPREPSIIENRELRHVDAVTSKN